MIRHRETLTWMSLVVLGGLAFSASCLIATLSETQSDLSESSSYTARLFGQSRLALSSDFYELADVYFHKGVGDEEQMAITNGFFVNSENEISPKKIVHMEGSSSADVLPWIWMAVRADPQNILSYQVGSFFLSVEIGRPDLAHKLLQEGRANNPFSYEIAQEDAIVYLKEKKPEQALKSLNAAIAFWPGKKPANDPDAMNDKGQILFLRSLVNENAGRIDEAIRDLEKLVALFPNMPGYRQHLELLKGTSEPSLLAKPLLNDMLRAKDDLEQVDKRHGGNGEADHSHH